MKYEGNVFRPPSEAGSLILQVTIGCSHNRCTFCSMYKNEKYRERELDEISADLESCADRPRGIRRVFLADGNALTMDAEKLLAVLKHLYQTFPGLQRVGIYANPRDILNKEKSVLVQLQREGLGIIYLGVETGNEELLEHICKGATREEIKEAGLKVKEAGIPLSVTVINGLGGNEKMAEHAQDTATLLNEIDPDYVGLLTLMVLPGTPLARQVARNEFKLPGPLEILKEINMMLLPLNLSHCIFRSNHASNYLPLGGTLPGDKGKLLALLDSVLSSGDTRYLRPDYFRGL
jgi:radical SAM superfamily enzyme YgiQ (UPF0313 family)